MMCAAVDVAMGCIGPSFDTSDSSRTAATQFARVPILTHLSMYRCNLY